MQKVILRDFQRKMHSFIKSGASFVVVSGEDQNVVLGSWVPSRVPEVRENNLERCEKCNINPQSYAGIIYVDGDEISLKICSVCHKRYKPANFKPLTPSNNE